MLASFWFSNNNLQILAYILVEIEPGASNNTFKIKVIP